MRGEVVVPLAPQALPRSKRVRVLRSSDQHKRTQDHGGPTAPPRRPGQAKKRKTSRPRRPNTAAPLAKRTRHPPAVELSRPTAPTHTSPPPPARRARRSGRAGGRQKEMPVPSAARPHPAATVDALLPRAPTSAQPPAPRAAGGPRAAATRTPFLAPDAVARADPASPGLPRHARSIARRDPRLPGPARRAQALNQARSLSLAAAIRGAPVPGLGDRGIARHGPRIVTRHR